MVDVGLRERKKQATRAALGLAAWRLTIERGYDNVRVEDIAEAAGVSVRTFSNYFTNKGQALLSVGEDRGQRMVAALRARPPGEDLWEALAAATADQFTGGGEVPRDYASSVDYPAELAAAQRRLQRRHRGRADRRHRRAHGHGRRARPLSAAGVGGDSQRDPDRL